MTEIHDQSYRRYAGHRQSRGSAWTVIAVTGIRGILRQRKFFVLLLIAWVPFVVRAVQIYAAQSFTQVPLLRVTAETFRDFLDGQGLFAFFVTIYAGAGLIANDRRTNALQIYLSKPLTRTEYIAGKLVILMAFLLLITWVPGLTLLLVQVLLAGSFEFMWTHLFLLPAITLFTFLHVLLASLTMLALSSLSKSGRYAGVLYAGAVIFSDAVFGALRLVTGGTGVSWVSIPANLALIGDLIFRVPPRFDTPWPVSLAVVLGLMVLSVVVLERRIRGVEVVA